MAKHQVFQETDIAVGELRAVTVQEEKVIVYRLDDGFFATQSRCTHLFAPMDRGKIVDECKIQCPLHRARFDIRTGQVVDWANFPPGIQLLNVVRGEKALRTFPVTVEDGAVLVDL